MAIRSSKRRKLNRRDGKDQSDDNNGRGGKDYLPGGIMKIELQNFMTYEKLTCKPFARLNLVLGPNGCGKSSVVCAIALGLGGEPQVLGRAWNVGAYVKRGEESGFIKITLQGETESEKIVVMRKIHADNKSEWLLNGKVVRKKDVVEFMRKFNIQVNNLTQFLPQDRVCEFAKLSPVELLEETEKAIGDPQLAIQHNALIEKSGEMKRLEVSVKQNGDTLNRLKALNAEQEGDLERVRQREELLSKVEAMRKKLPWLKYETIKANYLEKGEKEKDAQRKVDEADKVWNDLKEPIEEQKKAKAILDADCKNVNNLLANNTRKCRELLERESRLGVQVHGKYNEMEELRTRDESRQQRVSQAKEELATAELELANLPPYEPPKSEIDKLADQIIELDVSVKHKASQKAETETLLRQKRIALRQCEDRLKDMENMNNKLLQALRRSGAEQIFEAYKWLQENHDGLSKEVYGPVLLEVNVPNRDHAAYLENQVAAHIWKSFITQDAMDRDYLVKNIGSFDVPVLNYRGNTGNCKMPFEVSAEMSKFGIYSRLDQVFNSPTAVKEVLNSQYGLEDSYIGTKESDEKANDVVSQLGISNLWTPENHYRWSVSLYGGHVSASVLPVGTSRFLLCGSDVGETEKFRSRKKELEEAILALEGSIQTIQTEQRQLEDEASKLRKQREEILKTVQFEKRKRCEMENRVHQRKLKLESLDNEDDLETSIKKLVDQTGTLNVQRSETAVEIKNMLIEAVSLQRSFTEKHMASIELEAKIITSEKNLKMQQTAALHASVHLEKCKKDTKTCKCSLDFAKRRAESIAVITPELTQEFLKLPDTIEELEAAIQDNLSQANSIGFLNHHILQEYESRQRKIESIAKKLESDDRELEKCLAEIDSLKENWLPTLRNLVFHINETFSRNFQEMAVAGEVSLDEHGMDFDKYGILIKVKFREAGQLQVLSAHHQSGGERSVSTILYLVSLQDLTNCPFRVVDEINQGMDPINERNMFQQLVRAASQPHTPQCFLLTPKLLPDLEYSEACSILNIFTGPWIGATSGAWSDGDRWGHVMGLMEES